MSNFTIKGYNALESGANAGDTGAGNRRILCYPGTKRHIWAIGGGKGGVGKSLVTSNLGVMLSKRGFKVLIIDADLGAPNLHTFFGMEGPNRSLTSFLRGSTTDIDRVISRTPVPNVEIMSGAKDPLDAADLKKEGVARLKEGLKSVDHDYILVDAAPGTASSNIELFNIADTGIAVTTTEPTSIENTYRFLKCVLLGKIKRTMNLPENARLKGLLQQVFGAGSVARIKTFGDILTVLKELDADLADYLIAAIEHTSVSILVNKARVEDEGIGNLLKRASKDYFKMEIGFLGLIRYEERVNDSVRRRKPLAIHYAETEAAGSLEKCLDQLLDSRTRQAGV